MTDAGPPGDPESPRHPRATSRAPATQKVHTISTTTTPTVLVQGKDDIPLSCRRAHHLPLPISCSKEPLEWYRPALLAICCPHCNLRYTWWLVLGSERVTCLGIKLWYGFYSIFFCRFLFLLLLLLYLLH